MDPGIQAQDFNQDQDVMSKKGDFTFEHIKVIYPTAPVQPYTPTNGIPRNVWFDRSKISYDTPPNQMSINTMKEQLNDIVQDEIAAGIKPERIVIGGFSMGGSMALHLTFSNKHKWQFGGCFALSSFLVKESNLYNDIQANGSNVDVFMYHGQRDNVVLFEWGKNTHEKLKSFGVNSIFHEDKNLLHEIKTREIVLLKNWVLEKLPHN